MDREALNSIAANVKNVSDLIASPDTTAEGVERCAQALHIAAQTLLIMAAKP